MAFTDSWQSSNEIHEIINYCYDQIWEITIVHKLGYDLLAHAHEQSRPSIYIPIRDKLATGSRYQILYECSSTIRNQMQSFFVHNTMYTARKSCVKV